MQIGAMDSGGTTPAEGPLAGREMARVRAAAQEFEAALINSWWQAMQGSFSDQDGDKLTGDSGVRQDLSRQTMASAIAEVGGIGFASMMVRQLGEAAAGSQPQVSSSPADL